MTTSARTFSAAQRSTERPFDIRDGRIMLSLGPLSKTRYCTYRCPFCYVGGDFLSYASLTHDEIIEWVANVREAYDIIYVSADTDSFAPPREATALELLNRLSAFKVDLLFTTRAVLSLPTVAGLERIARRLASSNHMLIGCVSLLQLTVPHLEPSPIPSPEARIAQLGRFCEAGLRTVLALRPFLPNVPFGDLREIVERGAPHADVVLGGVWYFDQVGMLENAVMGSDSSKIESYYVSQMPFDNNQGQWHVFEGRDTEAAVKEACEAHKVPFFMRSAPAVAWLRSSASPTHLSPRIVGIQAPPDV